MGNGRRAIGAATILLTLLGATAACSQSSPSGSGGDASTNQGGDWYRPELGISWNWQLSEQLDTTVDADLYDIDLFDTDAATIAELQADGHRVLCYFSAGSLEDWRTDADQFPPEVLGQPLAQWEGEEWLDIRAPQVLDVLADRLDLAATKGCDGVEPDNVDGYIQPTGFDLTEQDQLTFIRWLAQQAHSRGLAVALKNVPDLVPELVDDFDLSITEQCVQFDECAAFTPFVAQNKPVLNTEYEAHYLTDDDAHARMCDATSDLQIVTMVLPLELDGSFRLTCP
ncbi:MAG: endo alpha-1,4 polygalactosaminidase [Beutenbergiaceae bacterium]